MRQCLIELEYEGHRYPVGVSEVDLTPTVVRLQQDGLKAELYVVPLPVGTQLALGKVDCVTLKDAVRRQLALLKHQRSSKVVRFFVLRLGQRVLMSTVFTAESANQAGDVVAAVHRNLADGPLGSLRLGARGDDGLYAMFLSQGPMTDFPDALSGAAEVTRELVRAVGR